MQLHPQALFLSSPGAEGGKMRDPGNDVGYYEKCSHQTVLCANYNRNMFISSMAETTTRSSFELSLTKHVSLLGTALSFVPEVRELFCFFSSINI